MDDVETLIQSFRQGGYRITPQRLAVFQVLGRGELDHPTAEQVCEQVRARLPETSQATVYNTLRELVRLGRLRRLDLGEGVYRYDLHTHTHAHMLCLECGQVFDGPEKNPAEPSVVAGFQVVQSEHTYYGYCRDCRKTSAGRARV